MGVKTVQLVESKGRLAGARIVRDGYQVMLISTAAPSSRSRSTASAARVGRRKE